jgi:hypothetical protein
MRLKEKELPGFRHRLFEHYKAHLKASAREAELRSRNETLSLDDYTRLRRDTSAVRVCFDLIEFVLGGDIPSEVFHDEVFQRVCDAGVDMVAYANVRRLRSGGRCINTRFIANRICFLTTSNNRLGTTTPMSSQSS